MRKPDTHPRRFAIAYHPQLTQAEEEARIISRYLDERGIASKLCASLYDENLRQQVRQGSFDVLVALGGDGTMLRAGRLCAPVGLPVLGINIGRFGFLIEIQRNQWQAVLPSLLEGNYWLEDRMMLSVSHWRGKTCLGTWEALNDVVVCRGQFVRPIQINARVDGIPLAGYNADGVIVSTATGSTAYAMAASGPVMPPELRNLLIIPVAPHLSMDRAIILAEGACVTLSVNTSHEAVLSVDGQSPVTMLAEDEVRAGASEHSASFVRFQEPGYFYRNLTKYMERNPIVGEES